MIGQELRKTSSPHRMAIYQDKSLMKTKPLEAQNTFSIEAKFPDRVKTKRRSEICWTIVIISVRFSITLLFSVALFWSLDADAVGEVLLTPKMNLVRSEFLNMAHSLKFSSSFSHLFWFPAQTNFHHIPLVWEKHIMATLTHWNIIRNFSALTAAGIIYQLSAFTN